ncbi:hypothetical protein I6A84_40255 [Frankia sp. CNm7]|uniref:WXG100 family type VII secretion target n=1 Tax=Frankia nepalensis TaxID=1836974 RepID=A0A937UQ68_9ACTN|nr:hypothetical protein [Frankia nepalensis]MBL7498171.1 hypothetical protein [Frankia nepalensis]MBL7509311.1 hypothetical protein [Frankia nepalensis]MBL7524111.1 hypothetical protein [Frankia nepalensis]MBL7627960.1 hypothetical protein [Frankia nepalensis]
MSTSDLTVRGTPEAVAAVAGLGALVNGPLLRNFDNLRRFARVLTDAENWDGRAATEFRSSVWPSYERALTDLSTQLDRLRVRLGEIQNDIQNAG